jgi:hypothetical protein
MDPEVLLAATSAGKSLYAKYLETLGNLVSRNPSFDNQECQAVRPRCLFNGFASVWRGSVSTGRPAGKAFASDFRIAPAPAFYVQILRLAATEFPT